MVSSCLAHQLHSFDLITLRSTGKYNLATFFEPRGVAQEHAKQFMNSHLTHTIMSSESHMGNMNASLCESLQNKQLEKQLQLERRREQNREAQRRFRQRARAEAALVNSPTIKSQQSRYTRQ